MSCKLQDQGVKVCNGSSIMSSSNNNKSNNNKSSDNYSNRTTTAATTTVATATTVSIRQQQQQHRQPKQHYGGIRTQVKSHLPNADTLNGSLLKSNGGVDSLTISWATLRARAERSSAREA